MGVYKSVLATHRSPRIPGENPPSLRGCTEIDWSLPLGQVVATSAVLSLSPDLLLRWFHRHQTGDWGSVDPEDWAANDRALTDGDRLVSSYLPGGGTKVWIITEWDRSATPVLLPEEY
ncbi:MAG: hypothetical protein RIS24_3118 [Verrucomicrobiota bacterium]